MKKVCSLFVITFIVLMVSCTKQEVSMENSASPQSAAKAIEVIDGRLKFANHDEFFKTLQELQKADLDSWVTQHKGFKSMSIAFREFETQNVMDTSDPTTLDTYKYVYKAVMRGEEKSIERAVTSSFLASMLNHEGLIQIGDNVLRINEEKVLSTKGANIKELDKENSRLVEEHLVEKIPIKISQKNGKLAYDQQDVMEIYQPSGLSQRRILRKLRAEQYWLGIQLNGGPAYMFDVSGGLFHQRKNWWGWGDADADGWAHGAGSIEVLPIAYPYFYFPARSQSGGASFGRGRAERYQGGDLNVFFYLSSMDCIKNGGAGTYNAGIVSYSVSI